MVTLYAFPQGGDLVRVDLTDPSAVAAFVRETRPAFLVHSAAQRFPDKVDGDTEAARRLNVASTETIAKAMGQQKFCYIYIGARLISPWIMGHPAYWARFLVNLVLLYSMVEFALLIGQNIKSCQMGQFLEDKTVDQLTGFQCTPTKMFH